MNMKDAGKCLHDRGVDWSYYPENNYDTQKTYNKKDYSYCPFCLTAITLVKK